MDRHHLVPARLDDVALDVDTLAVERLRDERGAAGVEPMLCLVGGPEFGGRGEVGDIALGACDQVVLDAEIGVGRS